MKRLDFYSAKWIRALSGAPMAVTCSTCYLRALCRMREYLLDELALHETIQRFDQSGEAFN